MNNDVDHSEVGIEKANHDAVETLSKNLKVSLKRSTRSTLDTRQFKNRRLYNR